MRVFWVFQFLVSLLTILQLPLLCINATSIDNFLSEIANSLDLMMGYPSGSKLRASTHPTFTQYPRIPIASHQSPLHLRRIYLDKFFLMLVFGDQRRKHGKEWLVQTNQLR